MAFEKIKQYRGLKIPLEVSKFAETSQLSLKATQLSNHHITDAISSIDHAISSTKSPLKTPLLTTTRCTPKYYLLVLVTTRPDGFLRRYDIRTTWARTWHQRSDLPLWKTVFQTGQSGNDTVQKKVLEENEKYKDIIIGNFTDTFYKLPLKVIMTFEWATKFCDFEFLLKTDDDVFVNIPNVFKFLKRPDFPRVKLYAGNVNFASEVVRNTLKKRHKKYQTSLEEYAYKRFPRFCSGGGFVLSRDVAASMVDIHNNSNYFKLDDVYIGMLALKLGVDAHHLDMFRLTVTNCLCQQGTIVRHGDMETRRCMEKLYKC